MKKALFIILSLLSVLSFTACANTEKPDTLKEQAWAPVASDTHEPNSASSEPEGSPQEKPGNDRDTILTVYFSRVGNTDFDKNVDAISSASLNMLNGELKGNTQIIAEMIHSKVGGDLFFMETVNKYPADNSADVLGEYARKEQESGARPELASHVENMDKYNTVFLGFPNWWYDMPMAVYSFIEEYDFTGKTVIPFCTNGGSRFSNSIKTLRELLPGATVLDGLAVGESQAADAQKDVDEWLMKLGIMD